MDCPAWADIRAEFFPGIENLKEYLVVHVWPSCTKLCGIINKNFNDLLFECNDVDFNKVHEMFLNISYHG